MTEKNISSFGFSAHVDNEEERIFLSEFMAQVTMENSRGKVINIVSFVDHLLAQVLSEFSLNKEKALKITSDLSGCLNPIMNKANVCHMLGLLTEHELKQIKAFANVRNEMAHDWRADFSSPNIAKRIQKLSSNINGSIEEQFMALSGQLVTQLHHRIGYAKTLREDLPSKSLVEKISRMATARI
ncbi:hypothetical protein [Vibrio vulnificus]|uniref:hypothetical protein n=1 Tax=Vibrio vulnificus TaxID=672 RepID=UPI00193E97B2|nr:hypothetical protein [Vibrio parahaemolyticus]MBM5096416.1 hypothetical protein [Vibrio parahaemolyticus]MBM5419147.1 hypothetical protein [Vibrio parahaemolyticus]MCF9098796.1 hypothetical protein [Vibrio parahaemolyticus]MCF9116887.1 hypothetical protein [Vibrio parahaemolyticus]